MLTKESALVTSADNVLMHLHQEFPAWNGQVLNNSQELSTPRTRHPVFFGSYDWHSSVHSHWALVAALPRLQHWARYDDALAALSRSLDSQEMSAEAAGFATDSFMQVPYGATWVLRLCAELRSSSLPQASRWLENLGPLEAAVVRETDTWLAGLSVPDRSGQHGNTAWSLQQLMMYADSLDDRDMRERVTGIARRLYLADTDAPFDYEPSAASFFSPLLNEASLMGSVLSVREFADWLQEFARSWFVNPPSLELRNAYPRDVGDYFEAHLVALPLTQSTALARIAGALDGTPVGDVTASWSASQLQQGLSIVSTDEYSVAHWISSYVIEAILVDGAMLQPLA